MVLIPLFISFCLWYFSYLFSISKEFSKNPDPVPFSISNIEKCKKPDNCTTLGYYTIGEKEKWIDETMRILAKKNELEFDRDVRNLVNTNDPREIVNYTNSHRNETMVGVIFCTDSWNISFNNYTLDIPCKFEKLHNKKLIYYSIYYNMTLGLEAPYFFKLNATFPTNDFVLKAKAAVDEALAIQFGEEDDFNFDIDVKSYPSPENNFYKDYDFFSSFGSFFFYLPLAFSFMIMISEMMGEKSKGIKLYMTVSGLRPYIGILSWTLYNLMISFYFSAAVCIIALVFGFTFFNNVPFILWFIYFFIIGFAGNLLALFISVIANANKAGFSLAYAFLMFSFVFQVGMTNPNSAHPYYQSDTFLRKIRFIYEFYPGFNYIKIWMDLVYFSGVYFDINQGRFVIGSEFNWNDFFTNYSKATIKGETVFPSIYDSFLLLLRNIVVFYILIFYFEYTLASNQGVSRNPIAWLKNKLSLCFKRRQMKRELSQSFEDSTSLINSEEHNSIKEEQNSVDDLLIGDGKKHFKGIILENICKNYKTGFICRKTNRALINIKFCIRSGEIFTILGKNGAGKTTLMNILTGFLEPNSGEAYLMGYSLRKELAQIRKITSLCPQNDIYWENLTIEEHLCIFAVIKGFTDQRFLVNEINRLLNWIGLADKKHAKIQHLSGGMRRRLSIAISAIGDPKIIIFDEPTTGLDPIRKHAVLNLLKSLKENRILILTTHSMEEADELSDRILFLKSGRVKCIGTSFSLKNEFSSGFTLSFILKKEDKVELFLDRIRERMDHLTSPLRLGV